MEFTRRNLAVPDRSPEKPLQNVGVSRRGVRLTLHNRYVYDQLCLQLKSGGLRKNDVCRPMEVLLLHNQSSGKAAFS